MLLLLYLPFSATYPLAYIYPDHLSRPSSRERESRSPQKPLAAVTYREEGSNGLAHDYRYFRTGASLRNYSCLARPTGLLFI